MIYFISYISLAKFLEYPQEKLDNSRITKLCIFLGKKKSSWILWEH